MAPKFQFPDSQQKKRNYLVLHDLVELDVGIGHLVGQEVNVVAMILLIDALDDGRPPRMT